MNFLFRRQLRTETSSRNFDSRLKKNPTFLKVSLTLHQMAQGIRNIAAFTLSALVVGKVLPPASRFVDQSAMKRKPTELF